MGSRFTTLAEGKGPPVVLIHGFPQDWFEYHAIMPRLAKRFTVIGVDLRGVGGSTATRGGYDAAKMAKDVYQLAVTLKLERTYSVGHGIGGMVAYAFVRLYPQAARGAMILDVPLTGIEGWDEIQGRPAMWHVRFMQVPGLAANAQFNAAQRGPNDVPLFLAAASESPFAGLVPKMADGLRANGCTHVETGLIPGGAHYVVEDQPEAVAGLIERHASPHSQ